MASKKPALSVVRSTSTGVQPPRKLGRHGKKLWDEVHAEYSITDRGGIELLSQICATVDSVEMSAECVSRDGQTIRTKTGIRAHPLLREILGGRAFIARGLERLGLNVESVKTPGRPGLGGIGWRGDHADD